MIIGMERVGNCHFYDVRSEPLLTFDHLAAKVWKPPFASGLALVSRHERGAASGPVVSIDDRMLNGSFARMTDSRQDRHAASGREQPLRAGAGHADAPCQTIQFAGSHPHPSSFSNH